MVKEMFCGLGPTPSCLHKNISAEITCLNAMIHDKFTTPSPSPLPLKGQKPKLKSI